MQTYVVAYEVFGEAEEVANRRAFLSERFRGFFPVSCRPLGMMWIVKSDRHAADIRDNLSPYLADQDKLAVILVADACAWRGLGPETGLWIEDHL